MSNNKLKLKKNEIIFIKDKTYVGSDEVANTSTSLKANMIDNRKLIFTLPASIPKDNKNILKVSSSGQMEYTDAGVITESGHTLITDGGIGIQIGDTLNNSITKIDTWIFNNLVSLPPAPTNLTKAILNKTILTLNWTPPIVYEMSIIDQTIPYITLLNINIYKKIDASYNLIDTFTTNEYLPDSSNPIHGLKFYIDGDITEEYTLDSNNYIYNLKVSNVGDILITDTIKIELFYSNNNSTVTLFNKISIEHTFSDDLPDITDFTASNVNFTYVDNKNCRNFRLLITPPLNNYSYSYKINASSYSNSTGIKKYNKLTNTVSYIQHIFSCETEKNQLEINNLFAGQHYNTIDVFAKYKIKDGYSNDLVTETVSFNKIPLSPLYLDSYKLTNNFQTYKYKARPINSSILLTEKLLNYNDAIEWNTFNSLKNVGINYTQDDNLTNDTKFSFITTKDGAEITSATFAAFNDNTNTGSVGNTYGSNSVKIKLYNQKDKYEQTLDSSCLIDSSCIASSNMVSSALCSSCICSSSSHCLECCDDIYNNGFWAQVDIDLSIEKTQFPATSSIYTVGIKHKIDTEEKKSISNSFYVDNINNIPLITDITHTTITDTNQFYISGVPSYGNHFKIPFSVSIQYLGNHFFRYDKLFTAYLCHNNKIVGSMINNSYTTGDHSGGIDTGIITISDFIKFSNPCEKVFTSDCNKLLLHVKAHNILGDSEIDTYFDNESNLIYVDTVSQNILCKYFDRCNCNCFNNIINYPSKKILPLKNYEDYPYITTFSSIQNYDHTKKIVNNSNKEYNYELQFVDGRFRTPKSNSAYLNYNNYIDITSTDYTNNFISSVIGSTSLISSYIDSSSESISSTFGFDSTSIDYDNFRYTTFLYDLSNNTQKYINYIDLKFHDVDISNTTISKSGVINTSDFRLYIKLIENNNIDLGSTYSSVWLDGNKILKSAITRKKDVYNNNNLEPLAVLENACIGNTDIITSKTLTHSKCCNSSCIDSSYSGSSCVNSSFLVSSCINSSCLDSSCLDEDLESEDTVLTKRIILATGTNIDNLKILVRVGLNNSVDISFGYITVEYSNS